MIRDQLMGALNNILNNFLFGLILSRIVPPEAWQSAPSRFATFQAPNGDLLRISVEPLYESMLNPPARKIVIEEFENCLKRSLLSEGHEIILSYCGDTNQFEMYKAETWFQFARIIRNVVSHKDGGILRKWPNDLKNKGITQAHWHDRTLDIGMEGTPVEFTHQEALQLFLDQVDFVMTKLS